MDEEARGQRVSCLEFDDAFDHFHWPDYDERGAGARTAFVFNGHTGKWRHASVALGVVALTVALICVVVARNLSSAQVRSEDSHSAIELDATGITGGEASYGSCAEYGCQQRFVAAQFCQCDNDCTQQRRDCCSDFTATCSGKAAAQDTDYRQEESPEVAELTRQIATSWKTLGEAQQQEPVSSDEDAAAKEQQNMQEAAMLLDQLMHAAAESETTQPLPEPEPVYTEPLTAAPVLPELEPVIVYEASTSTTTRFPFPSFLCWVVVRTTGYEVGLIQAQHANRVGIFDCDEYIVYSNGGTVQIGNIETVQLPAPSVGKGNFAVPGTTTNSWLNTLIFMEAWALIVADGRWWNHEWTVKIDPDAVFFPHRLRELLLICTPAPGETPRYVGNCDRNWHAGPARLKLFGSMEVFSRDAVGTYKAFSSRCKTELQWKGWGEDFFMKSCMDILGAKPINGTSFLADKRCHWAPCNDPTKVVYHDFKDVKSFFDCWGQSRNAEKMNLRRLSPIEADE